jgi:hypothetical protein
MSTPRRLTERELADIEAAIAPYLRVLDEFKRTPGDAVRNLLGSFDSLARNPYGAFCGLAKAYSLDPEKLVEHIQHHWLTAELIGGDDRSRMGAESRDSENVIAVAT